MTENTKAAILACAAIGVIAAWTVLFLWVGSLIEAAP
jgi:hypothetical protein